MNMKLKSRKKFTMEKWSRDCKVQAWKRVFSLDVHPPFHLPRPQATSSLVVHSSLTCMCCGTDTHGSLGVVGLICLNHPADRCPGTKQPFHYFCSIKLCKCSLCYQSERECQGSCVVYCIYLSIQSIQSVAK